MGGDGFQMSKYFVNSDSIDLQNETIHIRGDDVKHIAGVLRASPGDPLEVCDGAGADYDVVITQIDRKVIITKITGSRRNLTEPPVSVTLFQGVPKADRMDYIIQKCIEIGVKRIVPVMTARTVVKIGNDRDASQKIARWRRIGAEAAKQCNRGIIPAIEEPVRFDGALKMAEGSRLKLLPYEEERGFTLRRRLEDFRNTWRRGDELPQNGGIAVFIGPEGGFDAGEVLKAQQSGFKPVTLGPRILRTETAGMVVLSVIMYELGGMET